VHDRTYANTHTYAGSPSQQRQGRRASLDPQVQNIINNNSSSSTPGSPQGTTGLAILSPLAVISAPSDRRMSIDPIGIGNVAAAANGEYAMFTDLVVFLSCS